MEKGTATLAFPAPADFDFPAMAEIAVESSHRLRSITVELPGRFDGDAFVIDGTGRRLPFQGRSAQGPVRIRAEIASWDRPVLRILEIR